MKVAAIYQGNGKTVDNLTVITDDRNIFVGSVAYLGMDENGGHSFSQWGELNERDVCKLSADGTRLIFSKRNHLGKLIDFTELNYDTQRHIATRILV